MEEQKDSVSSNSCGNEMILSETKDLPKVIGGIRKKECQNFQIQYDVKEEITLDIKNNPNYTNEQCKGKFLFFDIYFNFSNNLPLSF